MGAGDLAELLRELKGRSGLSYGALAKRLHVSTSTLHRYVNGTAVPTEFAPVERLARLCKATPDELVEVHRRWIVADATRGRKAEPAAEPQEPEEPQESGKPDRPSVPEPEPEPAQEAEPAPEPEREPEREPEPAQAPETAPEPELVQQLPPRPKSRLPRGKRQRLGVLAAVGVVLAIGGTALAVHSASGSPGGDGKHSAVDDGPRPGTERSPSGTAKKDPSGTPSRPSSAKPPGKGEDKDEGEDERDGGGTKSGPRGGEGSEGRAPGSGAKSSDGSRRAPITVSTQPQYWYDECGRPYLIKRPPNRLPSPPTPQDAAGWVGAFDAVSAEKHDVKFTVQGTGKDTVVLESLNVRVVGRSDPPRWNKYLMGFLGVGCGGNVPKHTFNVKLDRGQPALVPDGDDFPYKVSERDPETFYVFTTVKSRYVRWYLELEWSSGSRHGTVVIDDEGKPFRTSGAPDNPTFGYTLENREWVKAWRNPDGGDGYEWEGQGQ
ncbi:helix-turn-helix domain-containing protein [Streptomyces sp. NRRL B-1347]|uniref:helix-turn-helix domain-containing protein n=1 Tax=Streptomyces sp. NRRL B-1347 TaxID=1476877 RepID=UPI000689C161|nr:helix-turn-helix transcriptional regulator [Streptomyces sp. NRRL B-1347]